MGAAFSREATWLAVALERASFQPGEVVQGVVCLNAATPIPSLGVVLKVKGYERSQWTTRSSGSSQAGAGVGAEKGGSSSEAGRPLTVHGGCHTFFQAQVQLAAPGTIARGQHQLPFIFTLPPDLPTSFRCVGDDYRGGIAYKLKAECCLEDAGGTKSVLCDSQQLHVAAPASPGKQQQQHSASAEVTTCGCFTGSHVTVTASLDSGGSSGGTGGDYRAGDAVDLALRVESQSKKPALQSVQVKLLRHIHLGSGGSALGQPGGGDTHNVTGQVFECVMPGFSKQSDCVRNITFKLPTDVEPGTEGRLVHCRHSLEIVCEPGGIKLHLPLTVRTRLPAPQWWQQPRTHAADWRPAKESAPTVFQFEGAPPVPTSCLQPENQFWQRVRAAAAAPATPELPAEPVSHPSAEHWLQRTTSSSSAAPAAAAAAAGREGGEATAVASASKGGGEAAAAKGPVVAAVARSAARPPAGRRSSHMPAGSSRYSHSSSSGGGTSAAAAAAVAAAGAPSVLRPAPRSVSLDSAARAAATGSGGGGRRRPRMRSGSLFDLPVPAAVPPPHGSHPFDLPMSATPAGRLFKHSLDLLRNRHAAAKNEGA